jgi:crotonobetainyl-CoA:carnitine CoA-transferase CaiB-like acyl-CoA transferase
MADRARHAEACVAEIDAAFASRPRAEWLQRLRDDPGDFIFTVVNSVDDLPSDPQVLANDYVVEMEHPQHGPTWMVGIPVGLSETPGTVRRPAPELGQDTEMVLMDLLGWDWERIETLREKEAI